MARAVKTLQIECNIIKNPTDLTAHSSNYGGTLIAQKEDVVFGLGQLKKNYYSEEYGHLRESIIRREICHVVFFLREFEQNSIAIAFPSAATNTDSNTPIINPPIRKSGRRVSLTGAKYLFAPVEHQRHPAIVFYNGGAVLPDDQDVDFSIDKEYGTLIELWPYPDSIGRTWRKALIEEIRKLEAIE